MQGFHKEVKMIIIDGIKVKLYPDNDGGFWYYHPKTEEAMRYDD